MFLKLKTKTWLSKGQIPSEHINTYNSAEDCVSLQLLDRRLSVTAELLQFLLTLILLLSLVCLNFYGQFPNSTVITVS